MEHLPTIHLFIPLELTHFIRNYLGMHILFELMIRGFYPQLLEGLLNLCERVSQES